MKNKLIYLLFTAVILFSNCSLDRNAIDSIDENGFYKNDKEVNLATLFCYSGLYQTMTSEWYLTELRSDNSRHYARNSTATTSKNIYAMDRYIVETSHPINQEYWDAAFANIKNCNTVLARIGTMTDEGLKNQYTGEVYFIRSLHYFNLVRLYGPMFIVDKLLNDHETKYMDRSSIEETYKFIENDLKEAVKLLPLQHKGNYVGRADRVAAKALLAKVYLTQKKYDEAKILLNEIINVDKTHDLVAGYENVFSTQNELNKEIIFTVRYKKGGLGTGSPFATSFAPANSADAVINGSGDGNNCPTNDLILAFASNPTDTRRDVTLAENWKNIQGVTVYTAYVKKFLSEIEIRYDAENDWPILRYADVLLMMAEVENELSGVANALPYLNRVRVRAELDELTTADLKNKLDARFAIEKERRLEFALENHRFFDLLRTDRLQDVMKTHFETEQIPNINTGVLGSCYKNPDLPTHMVSTTLEDWQLLLPIPFSVMNVMPNVTQNVGY